MELHGSTVWGPGHVVGGKYTLLGRLVVGGMAEIWLARQAGPVGFNRLVVVKRIIESLSQDQDFVQMFLDEARLGAQLSHPNIVQTVDFGEDEGTWYIVLEYLAGETLAYTQRAAREAGTPLPVDLAVRILSDATLGLSSAHGKTDATGEPLGIVHRDISPQNLFITYEGVVKVLDFGIAKAAQRSTQTNAGQVKGRISYMSPEQIRGEELDQRADVWSLGIVLYEAVTHGRLFGGSDQVAIMRDILSSVPVVPARTRNPQLSLGLDDILGMALKKDRTERFQTSALFRNALEMYLRTQDEPPELASYMQRLFAKRMGERVALVKKLSVDEAPQKLTASMLTTIRMEKGSISTGTRGRTPGTGSVSSVTGSRQPQSAAVRSAAVAAPARRSPLGLVAGIAVGVLAVVGAGWALHRASATQGAPADAAADVPPAEQPAVAAAVAPAPEAPKPAPSAGEPPAVAVPAVATTTAQAAPASGVLPATAPERESRERTVRRQPERRQSAAPQRQGRLTLDTVPWTQVYLAGRKLGETPLIEVEVPAGHLELKLVNESEAINTVVEVNVDAGRTTAKRLRL